MGPRRVSPPGSRSGARRPEQKALKNTTICAMDTVSTEATAQTPPNPKPAKAARPASLGAERTKLFDRLYADCDFKVEDGGESGALTVDFWTLPAELKQAATETPAPSEEAAAPASDAAAET